MLILQTSDAAFSKYNTVSEPSSSLLEGVALRAKNTCADTTSRKYPTSIQMTSHRLLKITALLRYTTYSIDKSFLYLSAAFNNIQMDLSLRNIINLQLNTYLIQCVSHIQNTDSGDKYFPFRIVTNVRMPQGCFSSSLWFTLTAQLSDYLQQHPVKIHNVGIDQTSKSILV